MMMRSTLCLVAAAAWLAGSAAAGAAADRDGIQWRDWNEAAFTQAREANRPIYLYLEAVWCHWCHVMDQQTFAREAVVERLNNEFIPVRADHDAVPSLADRYRAWGWPAQIWIAPDGRELVKRAGYIPADEFNAVLDRVLSAGGPGQPVAAAEASGPPAASGLDGSSLPVGLRARLMDKHLRAHDDRNGGLNLAQRFLDPDSVELDLQLAREGDDQAADRARQTLDAAMALIDPVWGGAYQYSTHGVWTRPHYEKIMRTQAAFLRIYSQAYAQFGEPRYRQTGRAVVRYLDEFLRSDEGAFFASQDADLNPGTKAHDFFALDDAGRRARGMPRIDRQRYAQHNGMAIEGLALWYAATGESRALTLARDAASWVQANLRQGEGYVHQAGDRTLHLADNLAMARAWLALYAATAERDMLARALSSGAFILQHFRQPSGGYSGAADTVGPMPPSIDTDDNISVARFFNLLARYSGQSRFERGAAAAMRHLARPAVALDRIDESGIILVADELHRPPVHATVVGDSKAPVAQALFDVLLRQPGWYRRLEWWDRSEGPLMHDDVAYPNLPQPAGYYCEARRCSAPQFEPAALKRLLETRTSPDTES